MKNMMITGSVGINGKNNLMDIKNVQTALNRLLPIIPPTKLLKVDGSLGSKPEVSKTVAAIKLFQTKVVGLINPDGRIDPNRRTHQFINKKIKEVFSRPIQHPMTSQDKAMLRAKLEQYEGKINHMYLDTKGFVTVGIGHLLRESKDAEKIEFVQRDNGDVAGLVDIRQEYGALQSLPYGNRYPASYYRSHTKLILENKVIDMLTDKHIVSFELELKTIYGHVEFNQFPREVKLALFDMIFNLGMTKLRVGFPKFNSYIKTHDWINAATESNRRDIAAERNVYVKNLLLKAGADCLTII